MKRMTLQIKAPSKCKDAEAPQGYIKKYTGRHQISDPSLSSRQSASGKAVFTSQSQIVQTAELQPAGISRRRRAHTVAAPSAISIVHTHTHTRCSQTPSGDLSFATNRCTYSVYFSLSNTLGDDLAHTLITHNSYIIVSALD